MKGSHPERRSYHSSFTYECKLYICGGLDIREGNIGSIYELDMKHVSDLTLPYEDRRNNFGWSRVAVHQNKIMNPPDQAYHTSVVFKDTMYMFGGNVYD